MPNLGPPGHERQPRETLRGSLGAGTIPSTASLVFVLLQLGPLQWAHQAPEEGQGTLLETSGIKGSNSVPDILEVSRLSHLPYKSPAKAGTTLVHEECQSKPSARTANTTRSMNKV